MSTQTEDDLIIETLNEHIELLNAKIRELTNQVNLLRMVIQMQDLHLDGRSNWPSTVPGLRGSA